MRRRLPPSATAPLAPDTSPSPAHRGCRAATSSARPCGPCSTPGPTSGSRCWWRPPAPARPWAWRAGSSNEPRSRRTGSTRASRRGPSLDRLLEEAGRREGPPALVVVDDAHLLPATAVRVLDARLGAAPDRLRVVLLTRWDLGLSKLVPQLLGHLTVIRGDALRLTDAETGELVRVHVPDADARCSSTPSGRRPRDGVPRWSWRRGPARRRRAAPTSYAGSGRPAPASPTSSPARCSPGCYRGSSTCCCAAPPSRC